MKEKKILVTLLQLNFQFVPTRRRKKEEPVALKTKNEIQLDVLLIVLKLAGYFRKMTFIQIKSLVPNFSFGVGTCSGLPIPTE